MPMIQQLCLFDPPTPPQLEQLELYKYPLVTLFSTGSSDLYYLSAATRQEAIALAEAQLRSKNIAFRNVACLMGTYWRRSHPWGYPCCPVERSRMYE
ncbi:hypothetical protein IFO70_33280 [Phormidium tenue FACHB-886]|nr:hypothetical protein [Phormidium tenue FACHB-886]